MSVIRLRAGEACQRCGASSRLPHQTNHDCLNAIAAEMNAVLGRTHALNRTGTLSEEQHQTLEQRRQELQTTLDRLKREFGTDTSPQVATEQRKYQPRRRKV